MHRTSLTAVALVCLAGATSVRAQEAGSERLIFVFSSFKCSLAELDNIAQATDSVAVPIAQELVDENKVRNYFTLLHDWGDEWSFVVGWVVEDRVAFFSAWEEWFSRLNERHPDFFPWFFERCTDHKDNIYRLGPETR
jgi:hypothetical protein